MDCAAVEGDRDRDSGRAMPLGIQSWAKTQAHVECGFGWFGPQNQQEEMAVTSAKSKRNGRYGLGKPRRNGRLGPLKKPRRYGCLGPQDAEEGRASRASGTSLRRDGRLGSWEA